MVSPAEGTDQIKQLLHKFGEVTHQIQKERGCASLFLDSRGKIFQDEYSAQTAVTDNAIAEVLDYYTSSGIKNILPTGIAGRLEKLEGKYVSLTDLRDNTLILSLRYAQALNIYTFNAIIPTLDTMIELAHHDPGFDSALIPAYSNFLQWKERIGMERALGARGLYTFSFRNQEFCDRFLSLIAEQNTYFGTFEALASREQIVMVKQALNEDDLHVLKSMNTQMEQDTSAQDIEQFSAESWFTLLTRMMDDLLTAEKGIVENLAAVSAAPLSVITNTAISPARHGAAGKLEHYRAFLKSLPTFSTLENDEFNELLSFAQIREYGKDKLLFLKEEPATRLYIILEGWVKVYNGLETGEEAILQMLSKGETLLESAVFLDVPAPISAQVVEPALLLSIPAPIIRQRIQSSPKLALNMLNAVSLRSQRLVQHIELSRLRTAKERVGWFLLRLAISQKLAIDKIQLPYEKSIIASYLDMRPETLSRTLQKFKQDGFEVASDHVIKPEKWSLCSFCDLELSAQCQHAHTEECPREDLKVIPLLRAE